MESLSCLCLKDDEFEWDDVYVLRIEVNERVKQVSPNFVFTLEP